MASKKPLRMNTMTGATTCGRTTAASVSTRPKACICWNSGTMRICGGTRIAATVTARRALRPRNRVRENAYAAIAEMSTVIAVTAAATSVVFHVHRRTSPRERTSR